MPLIKSASPNAIGENIKREEAAGKPYRVARAIALSTQDRARRGRGQDQADGTPTYHGAKPTGKWMGTYGKH